LTFPPCFDPTAQFFLQAKLPNGSYVIPSAPNPTGVAPGTAPAPVAVPVVAISRFRENQFNANLDFQLSTNNRFSGKYFDATNPTEQGIFDLFGLANALPVPGFGGSADLNQRVLALDDIHVLSSSMVNDARLVSRPLQLPPRRRSLSARRRSASHHHSAACFPVCRRSPSQTTSISEPTVL